MKNNITLNLNHPNKTRTEYFLNKVDEKLEPVLFNWRILKKADSIIEGYKFTTNEQSLHITVIFASSYDDANQIAEANAFPVLPHAAWSLNGDVLYLVESKDEDKVKDILSLFAGEE
ncbi:hypothetical protein KK060_21570 [Fulvivirgaceae bacterium PWU20]|uniref:DUF5655 domain-containing protein n=2 Tax=Chryseosolibacter indicus TaxID=2782351 RepID=A0ABS5VWV0_9BACT|nr:hypothetical protein [Chryseosolibacter indicus]